MFGYITFLSLLTLLLVGCSSGVVAHGSPSVVTTALPASPTVTPRGTAQASSTATPTPQSTPVSPDWIPLTSQSPSDIIAAAKKSTTYLINASGEGDVVPVTHLGTPLYVQGLSKSYSAALPDYYEIPSLNDSGAVIGSLNCQLNASHTAIYVGGAVEYGQPRTSGTVAQITPQQALAEIAAQHHTGLKAGTEPHLIYFPFDLSAEETGQINWRGGGNSMDDPMWEFVGTDGSQHFAGADGRAYYWNELPLAP